MFPNARLPLSADLPLRRAARRALLALLATLVAGCGAPTQEGPEAGSGVEVDAVVAGEAEGAAAGSLDAPHLDGAAFSGDVRPGLAAAGLIRFLETHVGAKVHLDVEISGFEGDVETAPFFFWLRPLCDREERAADGKERCRDSHVAILGPPEIFVLDDATGVARLRGTFGVEAPADPQPDLRAWRLVANPVRRSERPADSGG